MSDDVQLTEGTPIPKKGSASWQLDVHVPIKGAWAQVLWLICILLLLLIVVYPTMWILLLTVLSPSTGTSNIGTLQHVLQSAQTWHATLNTVLMAVSATIIASVLAVPMAWSCVRTNLRIRRLVRGLVFLTFMNPPILLGYAYIILLGPNNGIFLRGLKSIGIHSSIFSWWGLIFTTVCVSYPIIFMITASALENLDPELENAALAHGAKQVTVALRVTLPLAIPAILSGSLLAFVLALNSFGIQALIAIPSNIPLLTTVIYSYFSYPVQLSAAADLSVILIIISLVVTVGVNIFILKKTFPTITGKGFRPVGIRLNRAAQVLLLLFNSGVVFVTMVLPMVIVILSSLVRTWGNGFSSSNFSINSYVLLFKLGDAAPALENSFILGIVSAVLMVLLAISLGFFVRMKMWGHRTFQLIAQIPFVIPGIVLAVGMIVAYSNQPLVLYGTPAILVIAYVAKFLPIAQRLTENSLAQVGMELEESVYTHGGTRFTAFRKVFLPIIKSGLLAAFILSFIFAFNELSTSILLIGTNMQVTSTVLLHYNEEGLIPQMNAFSAILFVVTALCYLVISRIGGKSFIQSL